MKIKRGKKLLLLAIVMGFSCFAMAQQEPQFTQYIFNRMSYNPGYAGSSGSICASFMYRNQWMGLKLDAAKPGADAGSVPVDYLFTIDFPVKFLHGGLGLTTTSDKIGYRNYVAVNLDYAFRMFWGPGNLSAGVEANLVNYFFNFQNLIGTDDQTGGYGSYGTSSDPLLRHIDTSAFLIDVSVGAYYQVPGQYWLGLSVKNLLGARDENVHFKHARTAYAMGGFEYTPSVAPSYRIKPSFLLKTANLSTFQADLTCVIDYRNFVWGGLSYRVQDAISVLGGVRWKKLSVGLAYDMTVSKLGTFKSGRSFGTIEAYLKYCFKIVVPVKPPTSYGNTIYLL